MCDVRPRLFLDYSLVYMHGLMVSLSGNRRPILWCPVELAIFCFTGLFLGCLNDWSCSWSLTMWPVQPFCPRAPRLKSQSLHAALRPGWKTSVAGAAHASRLSFEQCNQAAPAPHEPVMLAETPCSDLVASRPSLPTAFLICHFLDSPAHFFIYTL